MASMCGCWTLFVSVALTLPTFCTAVVVYDNSLAPEWLDWSYNSDVDYASSEVEAVSAPFAVRVQTQSFGGWKVRSDDPFGVQGSLQCWLRNTDAETPLDLLIFLQQDTSDFSAIVRLPEVVAVLDEWTFVSFPMAQFLQAASQIDTLWTRLEFKSPLAQEIVYFIDDIQIGVSSTDNDGNVPAPSFVVVEPDMLSPPPQAQFSPYATQILSEDPVAWFRLGDAGPDIAKNSAEETSVTDGLYVGYTPGVSVDGAIKDDSDKAIQFGSSTVTGFLFTPGVNFVIVPHSPDLNSLFSWTLEAWVNPIAGEKGSGPKVVVSSYDQATQRGYILGTSLLPGETDDEGQVCNGSNCFWAIHVGTNGYAVAKGEERLTLQSNLLAVQPACGSWTYLSAIFSAGTQPGSGTLWFYARNCAGVSVVVHTLEDGVTFFNNPSADLYIGSLGQDPNGGQVLHAQVDEVAVYPYALTPAQALQHYTLGSKVELVPSENFCDTTITFRHVRMVITDVRDFFQAPGVRLAEIKLWTTFSELLVSALIAVLDVRNFGGASPPTLQVQNLIDQKLTTSWVDNAFVDDAQNPSSVIEFDLGSPQVITDYELFTSDGTPAADPVSWRLEGLYEDLNQNHFWVTLAEETSFHAPLERMESYGKLPMCIDPLALGTISLSECSQSEVIDCNGFCAPQKWIGDGECENGSKQSKQYYGIPIDLQCLTSAFDGLDCGCALGDIADCNGNCAPPSSLGNGVCENGDPDGLVYNGNEIDFKCAETDFDGGDCSCAFGFVLDCNGACGQESWIGDGICDDGGFISFDTQVADFNCLFYDFDGGDCVSDITFDDIDTKAPVVDGCGSDSKVSCLGGCLPESVSKQWIGDGICQSCDATSTTCKSLGSDFNLNNDCQCLVYNGTLVDLNCAGFNYDGGDCEIPAVSTKGNGEVGCFLEQYRFLRLTILELRDEPESGTAAQLSEVAFYLNGQVVNAISITNPLGSTDSNQGASNIYDQSTATQWSDFLFDTNGKSELLFDLGAPFPITTYDLFTGTGPVANDPKSWRLEGLATSGPGAGFDYELIDEVKDNEPTTQRASPYGPFDIQCQSASFELALAGDFEDSIAAGQVWKRTDPGVTFFLDPFTAYEGDRSLQVIVPGDSRPQGISQNLNLRIDETYEASAYVWIDPIGSAPQAHFVGLTLWGYTPEGASTSVASEWVQLTLTLPALVADTSASRAVQVRSFTESLTVFFVDEVSVLGVPGAAAPAPLAVPMFQPISAPDIQDAILDFLDDLNLGGTDTENVPAPLATPIEADPQPPSLDPDFPDPKVPVVIQDQVIANGVSDTSWTDFSYKSSSERDASEVWSGGSASMKVELQEYGALRFGTTVPISAAYISFWLKPSDTATINQLTLVIEEAQALEPTFFILVSQIEGVALDQTWQFIDVPLETVVPDVNMVSFLNSGPLMARFYIDMLYVGLEQRLGIPSSMPIPAPLASTASSYYAGLFESSPIAVWDMVLDKNSRRTVDLIGQYEAEKTTAGALTVESVEDTPGLGYQALEFDGSTVLRVEHSPALNPETFTVMAWAKLSDLLTEQPLFSSFSATNAAGMYIRCVSTASQSSGAPCAWEAGVAIETGLNVGLVKARVCEEGDCALEVKSDVWSMVVASLDNAELRLDVFTPDGEVHISQNLGSSQYRPNLASAGFLQSPQAAYIGGGPQDSKRSKLQGSISSVTIFDRSLPISTLKKQYLLAFVEGESAPSESGDLSPAAQFFAALSATPDLLPRSPPPVPSSPPPLQEEGQGPGGPIQVIASPISVPPGKVLERILYDDVLGPSVQDWSYESTVTFNGPEVGDKAGIISVSLGDTAWGAFRLHVDGGIVSQSRVLHFWVRWYHSPDTTSPPLIVMVENWPTEQTKAKHITLTEAIETAAVLTSGASSNTIAAATKGEWVLGAMRLDSKGASDRQNVFTWLKTTSGPFHFELDSIYITRDL